MAVGVDYQDAGYILTDGDEVSFFPPSRADRDKHGVRRAECEKRNRA